MHDPCSRPNPVRAREPVTTFVWISFKGLAWLERFQVSRRAAEGGGLAFRELKPTVTAARSLRDLAACRRAPALPCQGRPMTG
jgi:hypothetical protein